MIALREAFDRVSHQCDSSLGWKGDLQNAIDTDAARALERNPNPVRNHGLATLPMVDDIRLKHGRTNNPVSQWNTRNEQRKLILRLWASL